MMEKEPQISRQSQTWHVPCENGKQTHREATEKIQISIMLISNNKTIPFNYYLLAIQCEVEGFFCRNERGLMLFPVPLQSSTA